jgi:protocatechuate 3,4-dioxygenase alpha subunit
MRMTPTPSQTVGPYLHLGLTDAKSVTRLAGDGIKGERVRLTCRVLDGDGVPVPDAMIELWQADAEGRYPSPEDSRTVMIEAAFRGFGRLPTGEDGQCTFETIKPGPVPGDGNGLQSPHINVSIMGRGLLQRLATRIYFADDPANASDSVLTSVPENRRETLLARPDPSAIGSWSFEIRLCGEGETVFFDV